MKKAMSLTDTVKCAVLQLKGHEPLYYGRVVLSGDWYISVEGESETEQVLTWAQDEGESIVRHPYGQRMVRFEWLLEGRREPQDCALLELMEQHAPQSSS
jgi:hypothetical protein